MLHSRAGRVSSPARPRTPIGPQEPPVTTQIAHMALGNDKHSPEPPGCRAGRADPFPHTSDASDTIPMTSNASSARIECRSIGQCERAPMRLSGTSRRTRQHIRAYIRAPEVSGANDDCAQASRSSVNAPARPTHAQATPAATHATADAPTALPVHPHFMQAAPVVPALPRHWVSSPLHQGRERDRSASSR
jgi:hypothetical protein